MQGNSLLISMLEQTGWMDKFYIFKNLKDKVTFCWKIKLVTEKQFRKSAQIFQPSITQSGMD